MLWCSFLGNGRCKMIHRFSALINKINLVFPKWLWQILLKCLLFKQHKPYHSWQVVFRCGFHEIWRILWNLADFMKSSGFHVKSWDIVFPLHSMKVKSFSLIIWFQGFQVDFIWNPPDFMWNPPDFSKISLWVITKYRSFLTKDQKYFKLSSKCSQYRFKIFQNEIKILFLNLDIFKGF